MHMLGLSLLCFQILQLFFPEILFKFTYYSQNYSHILTIIPQKAALFSKTHANILIKHKQLYLVTNKYLKYAWKAVNNKRFLIIAIDTQNN